MKYCAYCGLELKDRERRCPGCGERCRKPGRKKRRLTAALLAAVLVLGAVAAGLAFYEPPVKLESAKEAARYMEDLGRELGLRNAMKDMEPVSDTKLEGDSFYRLQQTYKGIPVYGRTAVCMTDEDGTLLGIAQSLRDLPLGLELEPLISARDAARAIAAWEGLPQEPELPELTEDMLCIFDIDGDENVFLAYRIGLGAAEYLVDARQPRVLHSASTVDLLRSPIGFGTRSQFYGYEDFINSTYYLVDYDRSIYLLDPQGGTYFYTDQQSAYFNSGVLTLVTSPDRVFGNGNDNVPNALRAEPLLDMIRKIQDHFEATTSIPFDATLMLIYDDAFLNYNGENAAGGWGPFPEYRTGVTLPEYDSSANGGKVGMITVGTAIMSDLKDNTDVIAHEYTHILSRRHVDWTKTNQENGALNEAFSDIFGVLTEAAIKSAQPDWKLLSRPVDVPSSRGYPTKANEYGTELTSYPVTLDDGSASTSDFSHFYSTVISHAAYQMWQGIPGEPNSALSEDQLMRLWYRAMLLLPPDADFADCRQAVLLAADGMELDRYQKRSIRRAFDDADIPDPGEDFLQTVTQEFTLSVRDAGGERVRSYSVTVEETDGGGILGLGESWRKTFSTKDGRDLALELEKGTYELTIVNAADNSQFMTVNIKVAKEGEEELRLYTDFVSGAPEETQPPEQPTEAPAPVPEGTIGTVRWDLSLTDDRGNVLVPYYFEYLVLSGDTAAARKINADQYARAESHMTLFSQDLLEAWAALPEKRSAAMVTEVVLDTGSLLFVRQREPAGAGSLAEDYGWAYDLSTGEKLGLGDVVEGSDRQLLEQVRSTVWDYVCSRHGGYLTDYAEQILFSMDLEDFSYTVEDGQIHILFSSKVLTMEPVGPLQIPVELYLP